MYSIKQELERIEKMYDEEQISEYDAIMKQHKALLDLCRLWIDNATVNAFKHLHEGECVAVNVGLWSPDFYNNGLAIVDAIDRNMQINYSDPKNWRKERIETAKNWSQFVFEDHKASPREIEAAGLLRDLARMLENTK